MYYRVRPRIILQFEWECFYVIFWKWLGRHWMYSEFDTNGDVKVSPPQKSTKPPKPVWPLYSLIYKMENIHDKIYELRVMRKNRPEKTRAICSRGSDNLACANQRVYKNVRNISIGFCCTKRILLLNLQKTINSLWYFELTNIFYYSHLIL